MVAQGIVRLTASIPKRIVDQADEIATARRLSRSKLIAECLQKLIDERNQQILLEGYQAMAVEHKRFASLAEEAAMEVSPAWK
jgi:metal-responsive CopG/Arc/MetJ family transcriptional regulator